MTIRLPRNFRGSFFFTKPECLVMTQMVTVLPESVTRRVIFAS